MLGFPASTEFGKRIPKQKFYENLDVSPALRRVFVDQIRLVYWRNKLAASTLNIAAGESVTEIEVFEVRLNDSQLDEAVLKQIDKEIPYHILFILTCDGKAQAWIGYKEAAASGSNAFKVSHYYHTDWILQMQMSYFQGYVPNRHRPFPRSSHKPRRCFRQDRPRRCQRHEPEA